MQHRYVADVGDFGKFGLLNALLPRGSARSLRLGVLWCLTHPNGKEAHRNDGKHVSYLNDPRYRSLVACDPALHAKLREVFAKQRHLLEVQMADVLPTNTLYWEQCIEDRALPPPYRSIYRQAYLSQAALALREAELIFADPDNGIAEKATATDGKSILLSELAQFWELGKSVLAYNHRPRIAEATLRSRYSQFKRTLNASALTVFRFRKGSQRDFLLFMQPKHRSLLTSRSTAFQQSLWAQQGAFDVFEI